MYPKRFAKLQLRTKTPQYIIIHSTNCRCPFPSLRQDTKDFKTDSVIACNVELDQEQDCIFHYIIDKIHDDYYVIIGRPEYYKYTGFNFKNSAFEESLHICIIGDYNQVKAPTRLYEVLSYRLLARLLYQNNMPVSNILLHSDIDKSVSCPGSFFDKILLINTLKRFRVR